MYHRILPIQNIITHNDKIGKQKLNKIYIYSIVLFFYNRTEQLMINSNMKTIKDKALQNRKHIKKEESNNEVSASNQINNKQIT